jgi:NAD-dependent DNA ligase
MELHFPPLIVLSQVNAIGRQVAHTTTQAIIAEMADSTIRDQRISLHILLNVMRMSEMQIDAFTGTVLVMKNNCQKEKYYFH